MYEYIKGRKVLEEEHMLSATELAKASGLYTLNNNPNGVLVTHILADYVKRINLNVSEYYYPHSRGIMRVYPSIVYERSLNEFIFNLENGNQYSYVITDANGNKKKINYIFRTPKYTKKIISISERRNINGRK